MKLIAEILEKGAYTRLKERYGVLVDRISVEEELDPLVGRTFGMKFQLLNWKRMDPSGGKERVIGVGLAEIEQAIYQVLNFSAGNKGGNWQDRMDAGLLGFAMGWGDRWRMVPTWHIDTDGMPDRWIKISRGETGWTPKLVFEDDWIVNDPPVRRSYAKILKWYKQHKKEFG